MAISAQMVKQLRERTGAGMMECKKALVAADGDIEQAIDEMRKSGTAKAAKKAGRTAADGAVVVAQRGDNLIMLEVNSETDFVGRDEKFLAFANAVAAAAAEAGMTDVEQMAQLPLPSGESVEKARESLIQQIGENIRLRRAELVQAQGRTLGSYSHGGRIAAVVALEGGDDNLAKDMAMQISASAPTVIKPEDVPEAMLKREEEIYKAQAEESGKPAQVIEKMVTGRMRKFREENSLYGQAFVKDPGKKVAQVLKEAGADVAWFARYAVGEGIEVEQTDFSEEVRSQVQGT